MVTNSAVGIDRNDGGRWNVERLAIDGRSGERSIVGEGPEVSSGESGRSQRRRRVIMVVMKGPGDLPVDNHSSEPSSLNVREL